MYTFIYSGKSRQSHKADSVMMYREMLEKGGLVKRCKTSSLGV